MLGNYLSSVGALSIETRAVALTAAGLHLGAKTVLVRFEKGSSRLSIAADKERCLALLSVACARPMSPSVFDHVEAAAKYWQNGEPALANLRLVFARLPRLNNEADLARVQAAEFLLNAGMSPAQLLNELGLASQTTDLLKFDQDEPRVPAGQGDKGGEWTRWLQQPVPVYDQDTGIQVGTQSRARAIATNPLTVGIAGAAAMLGVESLLSAEQLTPFARQYLNSTGSKLGSAATRRQLYDIARDYVDSDEFVTFKGDGEDAEEYIPGAGPGTKGSTFVDFTAWRADGTAVRIQTIDTLADGVTPTLKEADAAARIRSAFPNDELRLIPKVKR